jgi:hypothetical protein
MAVFGTRPEAIKMLPVVTALPRPPGGSRPDLLAGQHAGMLDEVIEEAGERCDGQHLDGLGASPEDGHHAPGARPGATPRHCRRTPPHHPHATTPFITKT